MPKARYRKQRHFVEQPQDPSYRIIPLTKGQNALVDTEDYERVNRWNWVAHWAECTHSFYADREECGKTISMHRFIMRCEQGEECDHQNGNTLDNRKQNLRTCTHAQNTKNKKIRRGKQFIGIQKRGRKWMFEVMHNGQRTTGFGFWTPEEAAKARDAVAKNLHGEFASLNRPS